MLWTLFPFMIILAYVIIVTAPSLGAGIGFIVTLAWVTLLIYVTLFRKDEVSKMLED